MGILVSPNYPDNYNNHADCSFTIQAPAGQTVTLTINDLDIEEHASCSADAVEVFNSFIITQNGD